MKNIQNEINDISVDADNAVNLLQDATFKNIQSVITAFAKHSPHALHIAVCAASAALSAMSQIVSKDHKPNDDAVMFSAQLLASAVMLTKDGSLCVEASPLTLVNAFKACEKLTGRNIEDSLDPSIVGAIRSTETDPSIAARILQKRQNALSGGRTLH